MTGLNGFREIPEEQSGPETNDTTVSHDGYTYDLLVSAFTYILTTVPITAYHELSPISGQL